MKTLFLFFLAEKAIVFSCAFLLGICLVSAQQTEQRLSSEVRKINIDLSHVRGDFDKFYNESVGAGRAYSLMRADHQQHIAMAAKECGFKYLRFHGLYQDDMGVYRLNKYGEPFYSWQYVDAVYDFILSIGMRPVLVFDFMPEALASGTKTIYWEKANITPPKDYGRWYGLVKATVEHFTQRYGLEEVRQWLFEVWNEPDGYFFTGDLNEYLKLYDYTARAVKSVSADYRVGGPAIAGNTDWITALVDHCHQKNVPLDYISSHAYSTREFYPDSVYNKLPDADYMKRVPVWSPGTPWAMGNVAYNPDGVMDGVKSSLEKVSTSPMPYLEVYFTEWGLTWDYWDPLRDAYQAASYLLTKIKEVDGQVKSLSYCEVSDVFEEDGPPTGDFHGGFGLINLQGIPKPAYFAYKYLNRLGNTELICDDPKAIACKTGDDVQILFWNNAHRQNDVNKIYYAKDTPPLSAGKVAVLVSGLKPGKYRLNLHGVGYRQNDAYTAYLGLKYDGSISREQVAWLKEQSNDTPLKSEEIIIKPSDKPFEFKADMRENDVFLILMEYVGA